LATHDHSFLSFLNLFLGRIFCRQRAREKKAKKKKKRGEQSYGGHDVRDTVEEDAGEEGFV
jgi:hypothetical protein